MPNKTTIHKILIIEDDRSLARLYQIKLEKSGYEIQVAYDGEEGFEQITSYQPDIILLDIIIPKIDGFEVLRRLKADASLKSIPVILLTNLGQEEDMAKGKALGANDYLIKANFTPAEVVKKMEGIFNK